MTTLDTHPAAGQAALRAPPATCPHASQEDLSFHRADPTGDAAREIMRSIRLAPSA